MLRNNLNLDLVNMNAYIKFGEILSFRSQDTSGKEILKQTLISDITNERKMACNNPNLGLVDINSFIKFGKIL